MYFQLFCEDIDNANVIFRTGPLATYLVLAGTTLVTLVYGLFLAREQNVCYDCN